ncbi:MAG: YodL domain-containing protein, partial [Huintestinicola sp.]
IVEENKTIKQKINTNDDLLNIITDAIPDILTAEEYEIYKNDLGENISHLSDQNKFDRFGLGISPVLRFEKVEFEAGTEFNINGTSYKAISTNILATNAKTASEELETVFNNDFSSQKTWEESELRNLLSEKWVSSYILNNEEITAQEEKKTVLATDLKVGDIILINNTTMMDSNFKPVEIAPELVCVNEVNDNGISYKSYDPETNTTTFKSSGFITFELLEKTGFEYKDNSIDIESEKPVESEKPIRIYMGVRGTDEPIANNPRKVFEGIIQSAGLEPTEDISVDETQKMLSSLRIAEIELDDNEYSLEFDVEDEGLIIRDSATNKEYICIWGLARELMSMIAYDNNISRENFVSNEFENKAAAEENITRSPVGNELPDFTDCIDYLKGRMGISGSLLGKMSKWDYSDDDKDRIYDEWVSAYSDKVGYIFDPDYIHYGNAEQPNKNKAFYDYYLEHKDEVLREVFNFVYDEAKEQGDNIRKLLADEVMHGSGVQDGKFRINEFYSKNKDIKEFAQFIKNEYGIGGHSGEGEVKFANHDGKGIEIITQNDIVYDFKWNEVAKAVASAIDANTYITENDVKRRIHNARFHLENFSDGMSEQERKYYTDILAEYQLGVATINEQELIDLVKEQIKEDDAVFSDHYSITSPAAVYNLPEGTMRISEMDTKFHVADYRYDAEKGEFIVSGNTNSDVRKMIRNALETALSEKNSELNQIDDNSIYEEVSITQADIDILRTLPARKSVLNFSENERNATLKWQTYFNSQLKIKSPFLRAINDTRANENTQIPIIVLEKKDISYAEIRNDIKDNVIKRGIYINSDTGWKITVSRKGIEDSIRYAYKHNDSTPYNMLYSIPNIIENSIFLDTQISERNKENKAQDTAFMHKLYCICRSGNEKYIAKISVEEFFNGNEKNPDTLKRLYNVQDIKIEPLRNISLTDEQLHSANLNGTEISIAQLFDIVKTYDKDFYLNKREKNDISHSPVGNEPNKQEQQTPKREQSDAQKGKSIMNNVIVGTIDYKNIKVKKFINNISIEDCQKVVDELTKQGIPFSGLLQYKLQKGTITVSPENYKAACDALAQVRSNSPVEKKNTIIGNKPYKYISDKKFIKANEADIRKLADILTEQNVQFSGCIYSSDNATITVSGAETEKLAAAYLNYVRNTSIVNKLADYNFTLVDVKTLTVKDKNDAVMSFDSYEDMENAFNDIENEFFHPTYYQLGIITHAIAEVYAVQAMDSTTGKEKHIEKDADGYYLTFDTVTDAISYVQSNNISIANTDTELENWKKRDAAIHMDKMQELINQFGDEEHLIIRPDETISWTYFNPDGNNGNGQLVEMEINESVITEAYEAYRTSNDFDEFTNYIFSNAETHLIDADREDFEAHAKQFIAEKDNDDVYILTTYTDELVERLTDNFTNIRLAKQAEKLDLEAISAETAYDMAVQAKMSIYDKDGNAVAVEELGGEAYATAADVQKWGQIETISNFVDEINSYVSDNPSVNITEYQRDASEEGYEYAIGASEWENTARSLSQGKFEWLKTWLNDVKYNTIFNDITVLTENAADILKDYEETYYVPDKAEPEAVQDTVDIEKIIADKQNEMKDAMNAGDYAKVSELAQELNTLTSQKKEQETASHSPVGNETQELTSFIDDEEKMRDFRKITKEEFLESYSYITEAEYEMTEKEAFCLTVPELDIDVDMRKIDHIEVQTSDNKLIFYYSKNSNDIERAWESDDNSDTAVSVEEVRTDLLNSKAAGFIINVYETGSVNLFAALDYDVNKEFADFVDSMDFEVVKVGSEFSLRDDANFGDIHSDTFNNAAAMTDRLDIYINDYYIEDIAGQMKEAGLDDIVNIDEMTSLESIYNAINANSADDRMKKFFNDNLSDMRKLDLVINKVDAVDLNIAFQEAKIEPTYTIYQVKDGEEYRGVAFNRWKDLKELNIPFDKNNYESVYSGRISDVSRGTSKNWVLDDIYAKFNDNNRPDDFEGNSLSMSDVIVLEDENGRTAHYVDRYGTAD